MMGQRIMPGGHAPMAEALDTPHVRQEVNEIDKSIRHLVGSMPSHAQFLKHYCPAAPR